MKTPHRYLITTALLGLVILAPARSRAQGSFPPTTLPAVGTMKSLQQLWDKMGLLETKLGATQTQLSATQVQLTATQAQLALLSSFAANLSWILTTVDSAGDV